MSDIFISYSHKDADYLKELKRFLKPLEKRIGFWSDEGIEVGADWSGEIADALDRARLGLLLVSPDFLASEFIARVELPALIAAAEAGRLRLVILYLRTSNVDAAPIAVEVDGESREVVLNKYQGVNSPNSPIGDLVEDAQELRNKVYLRASQAVASLANEDKAKDLQFRHRDEMPDELRAPLCEALPRHVALVGTLLRGSRSIVYRAHDEMLDRPLAVKVIDPSRVPHSAIESRLDAARRAGTLRHRGLVSIHAAVRKERLLYIVMELVDGITLDRMVRRMGAQPLRKILPMLIRLADMLDYSHRHGFVHGTLSPSNVLVDAEGWPMVSPFRVTEAHGAVAARGPISRELVRYASPEQYAGDDEPGPAADQYALALIAHELLSGRPLFDVPLVKDLVAAKNAFIDAPPPPAPERSDLPPLLIETLARMLSAAPEDRFASMNEVVEQLTAVQCDLGCAATERARTHYEVASASFSRLRARPDFFESFYARFLPRLAEAMQRKFPMEMDSQYRMLREAIEMLLLYPLEGPTPALERLARAHAAPEHLGLGTAEYDEFLASLLWTVQHFEANRGEEAQAITASWRLTLRPGFRYLKRFCQEATEVTSEDSLEDTLVAAA